MDDRYQYLLLMAGCLLITLPLEFVLRARVYRRPRRLLLSLLPVLVVFLAWDVVGIWRGHWWYSPDYTTGILLLRGCRSRSSSSSSSSRSAACSPTRRSARCSGGSAGGGRAMPEYTVLAVLSVLRNRRPGAVLAAHRRLPPAQYWIAMAIVFAFQVVVDGWLTKLSAPIVIYDEGQIIGVRVPWDIPVEDYLFGFSMITLTPSWLHLPAERADAVRHRPRARSRDALEHARAHPGGRQRDAEPSARPSGCSRRVRPGRAHLRRDGRALAGLPRPAAPSPPRPSSTACPAPSRAPTRSSCSTSAAARAPRPAPSSTRGPPAAGRRDGAVQGVDASEGMVAQARAKAVAALGRGSLVSDAVAHLESLPDGSVDGVLAAYLLRNVPDRERLVREVARVLRPGGALAVHDYSVAGSAAPGRPGPRSATASSSRWPWLKRSDVPLTATSTRACATSTPRPRSASRLRRPASSTSGTGTYTGWQHGLVHTVVGSSPSVIPRRTPRAGVLAWTAGPSSTSPRPPAPARRRMPTPSRRRGTSSSWVVGSPGSPLPGARRARGPGHAPRARGRSEDGCGRGRSTSPGSRGG